jgi:hypothetical protein
MTSLLRPSYTSGQMTYDLRRLPLDGLIHRIEHTNRHFLTPVGIKFAIFYTKLCNRLLRPLMAADQAQAPPELRQAWTSSASTSMTTSIAPTSGKPRENLT